MTGPDKLVSEPLLLSELELDPGLLPDPPGSVAGAALVPTSQCFEIALPNAPTGRRDLLAMLADHAPVLPEHLAWTDPIAGPAQGAKIIVVRREWLDEFVGDLERTQGCIMEARTEHDHLPFRYHSPASRRARSVTLGTWIVSLIVAGIAILAMPGRKEQADPPSAADESYVLQDTEFAGTDIVTALTKQPFANLPKGLVAGISGKRDGSLLVELNTLDPDALRDLVDNSGLLPGFRETGQARSRDGAYLAAYTLEKTGAARPAASPPIRVPVLRASNAAEAIAKAEQTLIAHTAKQGLQLGVIAPPPNGEATLEFDIELAGPQEKVLAAIDAVERGSPPMRFGEWELTPDRAGDRAGGRADVRLAATLIVPWARAK